MKEQRTKTYYYTEGNTVRRAVMPEPAQEEELLLLPRERGKVRRRIRPIALVYTMLLAGLVVLFGVLCVTFLNANASINASKTRIYRLENRLEQLRSDNDTLQNRLNAQTDLSEVRQIATEQLGMVYPDGNEQISFYSQAREYVRQYEDIPGK